MENELKRADAYLKRPVLADLMGTNENYLSVLCKTNSELSPMKRMQLKFALRVILDKLTKIWEEL